MCWHCGWALGGCAGYYGNLVDVPDTVGGLVLLLDTWVARLYKQSRVFRPHQFDLLFNSSGLAKMTT